MPALVKAFHGFEEGAWHMLGTVSNIPMSAKEILVNKFNNGFTVSKRHLYSLLNGDPNSPSKYFSIVRSPTWDDPNEVEFATCSDRYNPLQPWEVAECFDRNIGQPVETMAFLGEGNDMFISWRLPFIQLKDGDLIKLFGIVRTGFDTLNATRLFSAIYRPVCYNTVTLAEGWANAHTDRSKNQGIIWKGKGVNPNLLEHLGYWMEHVQAKANRELENIEFYFNRFIDVPLNDEQVKALLLEAFPGQAPVAETEYPYQLIDGKNEEVDEFNTKTSEVREDIFALWSGQGTAITPNAYGLLNATSEYFVHYQPSKKPTAASIMFGGRQRRIIKMVDVLLEYSATR